MTRFCVGVWVVMIGCAGPPDSLGAWSRLSGSVDGAGLTGDSYLFLVAAGSRAAAPRYETAVSHQRLSRGDDSYVFAKIVPDAYRLSGFLDVNQNFRADVDVLAQPGVSDRPLVAVDVSLDAGENRVEEVALQPPLRQEPPAFEVLDGGEVVELPDQPFGIVSLILRSADLGLLEPSSTFFVVSATGTSTNGIPDLWPRLFLKWVPRPGQTEPADDAGLPLPVIVPLAFDPFPYLQELAVHPGVELATPQLTALLVPQAETVQVGTDGGEVNVPLPAIPVGDYELWVLEKSGQYWHLPNGLGGSDGAGRLSNQGVSFRFVHAT